MLDRVSIGSPCSADWDSMPGDERVRHCSECDKNVYNLSAMTRRGAESLLRETEGKLCARVYYRPDGTVMTERCPAALRSIGRRISRVAGAAMSAMMAFTSTAVAQVPLVQISPEQARKMLYPISGVVDDASGAVIPDAKIVITAAGTETGTTLISGSNGRFRLDSLSPGKYKVRIERPGFMPFTKDVSLGNTSEFKFRATMQVGSSGGVMIIAEAPPARR